MPAETITARGLQGAVAITTARLAGLDDLTLDQILGDTPPAEALDALSTLVASVLSVAAPKSLPSAVQYAGALAGRWEANSDRD